jgi:hypothetical protein
VDAPNSGGGGQGPREEQVGIRVDVIARLVLHLVVSNDEKYVLVNMEYFCIYEIVEAKLVL